MRQLGMMGRVAVGFGFSTVLPVLLTVLNFEGITTLGFNIMVLMMSGMFFAGWIYMGIVLPVGELKRAAKRIEAGDLDFTLETENDDEFGELMQAFEQMRIRLKQTQEEKLKNELEHKELVSNIAHDLKTPLTTIKGYSEGILDGIAKSPEKQLKYMQTIFSKANEMDRLIDELNYYAKIESNKIPYNFQHINAAEYFSDCVDEIGLDMESRGFAFGYYTDVDAHVEIIADPEQLRKVINNIVSNSIKYMDKPEGGAALSHAENGALAEAGGKAYIGIRLLDAGDFVEVEILDNGQGISKKDLPYIFERFFRSDSSRNSLKGGSGIGLSIAKKIMEDSGGRIWAKSEEGQGTEIHFVLRKYVRTVLPPEEGGPA